MCFEGSHQEREKTTHRMGDNFLQTLYLKRDLNLEHIKNSYVSITRGQLIQKAGGGQGKVYEDVSPKKTYKANKQVGKRLSIICHQGDANQNTVRSGSGTVVIKGADESKSDQECGKSGTHIPFRNVKWFSHFGKQSGSSSKGST